MSRHSMVKWKAVLGSGLCGAAFFACASPASATPTTTPDQTLVQAYNGNSAYNYGGPGFSSPGVGDVLQDTGHDFDTSRVVSNLTKSGGFTTLSLQFYTTFNGNDETARYADIFLGNPNTPGAFNYAISVGDEGKTTGNNGGLDTVGFYSLGSSSAYETSQQIWASKTGYIYGGEFKATDGQFYASPTVVTPQATLDSDFTTTVTESSHSGDANYPYLVDVTLMASNQNFSAFFGSGLSVFWGTGDCSNDAVEALLSGTPTRVPEPMTLAVFGVGVAGAAAMRARKKNKAA